MNHVPLFLEDLTFATALLLEVILFDLYLRLENDPTKKRAFGIFPKARRSFAVCQAHLSEREGGRFDK
ncbi:hypothetical protein FACS1894205_4590 [Alphaproteobacteria bacterium]|nr:hypothetical protein FACS1894205_4590 [Alphaproteobacteria bacterium]